MILVDANLLLYAYDTNSPYHATARRWLEEVLSDVRPVRLAWVTVFAFLRISTDARALRHPFPMPEAVDIVASWLARPNVGVLEPMDTHWDQLTDVLAAGQIRGPLVTDAHLAALALEHGAILCSTDRDFARFPDLQWTNPLTTEA